MKLRKCGNIVRWKKTANKRGEENSWVNSVFVWFFFLLDRLSVAVFVFFCRLFLSFLFWSQSVSSLTIISEILIRNHFGMLLFIDVQNELYGKFSDCSLSASCERIYNGFNESISFCCFFAWFRNDLRFREWIRNEKIAKLQRLHVHCYIPFFWNALLKFDYHTYFDFIWMNLTKNCILPKIRHQQTIKYQLCTGE